MCVPSVTSPECQYNLKGKTHEPKSHMMDTTVGLFVVPIRLGSCMPANMRDAATLISRRAILMALPLPIGGQHRLQLGPYLPP